MFPHEWIKPAPWYRMIWAKIFGKKITDDMYKWRGSYYLFKVKKD